MSELNKDFTIRKGVLVSYNSKQTDVVIPSEVTVIGLDVFRHSQITSVTLHSGITKIMNSAFNSCKKLKKINIPYSVTEICDFAFSNCEKLEEVIFNHGIKTIGDYAFHQCKSLTSVNLPDSIDNIGSLNFVDSPWYANLSADFNIFGYTLLKYNSSNRNPKIPNRVKTICYGAFKNSDIESVIIPDSVTNIQGGAFIDCANLQTVEIPPSVKEIGMEAFEHTPWLENQKDEFVIVGDNILIKSNSTGANVAIPSGVRAIAYDIFKNNDNITALTIPNTVTHIFAGAFESSYTITSVKIPSSVVEIGYEAFSYTTWYENLKDDFTIVGDGILLKCLANTQTLTIPSNVKTVISDAIEYNANVEHVIFPEGVKNICTEAIVGAKVKTITLPNSVEHIGEQLFTYEDTFDGFFCDENSYAAQYALHNNIAVGAQEIAEKIAKPKPQAKKSKASLYAAIVLIILAVISFLPRFWE